MILARKFKRNGKKLISYCRQFLRYRRVYKGVYIGPGVKLLHVGALSIGTNTRIIGPAEVSAQGSVSIGRNCSLAPYFYCLSTNHNYESDELIPYDYRKINKSVVIGDHVWIGARVIVNPGVSIGLGAIIASGSVVVKDVAPFEIHGGNPAKFIATRKNTEFLQKHSNDESRWYKNI